MINKRRFSIKNTKKVLHKVGKHWVVVSALLLGLVAGGTAVTTQANANAANTSVGTTEEVGAQAPATQTPTTTKFHGHNIPTNSAAVKSDAVKYASYADVNNLTKVASVARANTTKSNNASSAYADLVNLANNPSGFVSPNGSMEVGYDVANNKTSNTLFSMFDQASEDIGKINSGAVNSNHLTKASNAFTKASSAANYSHAFQVGAGSVSRTVHLFSQKSNNSYVPNSTISIPLSQNQQSALSSVSNAVSSLAIKYPKQLSGLNISDPSITISNASATISIPLSSAITISVPHMINNGYNIPSSISSIVTQMAYSASAVASNSANAFVTNVSGSVSNAITTQVSNITTEVNKASTAVSGLDTLIKAEETQKAAQGKTFANVSDKNNEAQRALTRAEHAINTAKTIGRTPTQDQLNHLATLKITATGAKEAYNIAKKAQDEANAIDNANTFFNNLHLTDKINTALDTQKVGIKARINDKIKNISGDISNKINKAIGLNPNGSVANSGKARTEINNYSNLFTDNGKVNSVGPFESTSATLGNASALLTSNIPAIDYVASLGASLEHHSLGENSITALNKGVNNVAKDLSLANFGLNGIFSTPTYKNLFDSDYSELLSGAAALASNYDYNVQHSAYSAIDNGASGVLGLVPPNVPHYNGINSYANSAIINEAHSTASSMASTSASMFNFSSSASNALTSASKANTTLSSIENSLLDSASENVSNASSAYNSTLSGQDTSEPALVTDNITFEYNGSNSTKSTKLTGLSTEKLSANALSSLDSIAGYSLANSDQMIGFNPSNTNVTVSLNSSSSKKPVTPNNTVSETVEFVSGSSVIGTPETFNGSNGTSESMNVPSGYAIENNDSTFSYAYDFTLNSKDTNPVKVPVVAVATDTINYQYNGQNEGNQTFTGALNTPFTINNSNATDITSGYRLANSTNLTYDGGTYNVSVVPESNNNNNNGKKPQPTPTTPTTDTIDYQYNGNTVANQKFTKPANSTSFTLNDSDATHMPSNYHLVNNNQTFNYNGSTTDVAIAPNQVTDTINYQYNGKTLATQSFTGNTVSAKGADNTSFDVNNSNDTSIPNNYHLVNANNNFNYDGGTYDVAITPNQATDIINYMNGSQKVSSSTFTGKPGDKFTASIPSGYHAISNTNFTYDGQTHIVNVAPNSKGGKTTPSNPTQQDVNDIINYMNGSQKVSSSTFTGKPGDKFTASIPSGYHATSNTTFTYDGQTHIVNVALNNNNQPVNPSNNGSNNTNNNGGTTPSNPTNNNNMPFIPSVPTFNNGSMASTNASASAEPNSMSTNTSNSSAEPKARVANYVTVEKELQLHTSPNFTKNNRVMTVEPGTRLDLEKTVRARHGLVRYEVNYKGKSYFVTANKKFTTHLSYELAKPSHYRYFKVGKALQLHTSPYFTKKNGVMTVKPGTEFRINRVVKAHGFVRYEVSYKGSVYFVTANKDFSANAYLQKSNFGKRGHKAVRVIKKLSEYKKLSFAKHSLIRNFRKGSVLPVKRVITIANGEMTRLQLTNGRYVSANKDFVKVIK